MFIKHHKPLTQEEYDLITSFVENELIPIYQIGEVGIKIFAETSEAVLYTIKVNYRLMYENEILREKCERLVEELNQQLPKTHKFTLANSTTSIGGHYRDWINDCQDKWYKRDDEVRKYFSLKGSMGSIDYPMPKERMYSEISKW